MRKMENKISQFILNRRLAQVKKYHNTPLQQNENVAEHTFYVTIIARALCGLLEESGTKINTLEVMEKAMVHDMEEMFSGDILQPFKYSDPELKHLLDKINEKSIEKAFEGLPDKLAVHFKSLWSDYHESGKIEDKIVKIADRLSLIAYCIEQIKLGNRFMIEILENGLRQLKNHEFEWLNPIISDIETEKKKLLER